MNWRRAAPAYAIAAGLVLGACSTTTNLMEANRVDYKSSGQLPPLEIPPDLTTPVRDNRYIVPDSGKSSATLSGKPASAVAVSSRK